MGWACLAVKVVENKQLNFEKNVVCLYLFIWWFCICVCVFGGESLLRIGNLVLQISKAMLGKFETKFFITRLIHILLPITCFDDFDERLEIGK